MEADDFLTDSYLLPNFNTVAFLSADGSTVQEVADDFRRRSPAGTPRPPHGRSWNGESRDLTDRLNSICTSWTFQTHDCEHSPLTARAAANGQDAAVQLATWALTTWPPIALAQPLLANFCTANNLEAHGNAQQQLLRLEEKLGTLIPQAAYCGLLELYWTFPDHKHLLVRWLLSKPDNLSKRVLTSQKILRNLQRSLVVTLGIRGPGGAPGDPSQAILPNFREVLGGQENQDWFVVDGKHACDVMGFLTPHMHVTRTKAELQTQLDQVSPPLAMDLQYACEPCTSSPGTAAMQPHTPDLVAEGGFEPSLSRRLSHTHTPSGLAVIPENENTDPQEDEESDADSEQLDDYVTDDLAERDDIDSGVVSDVREQNSTRHIFSHEIVDTNLDDFGEREVSSHTVYEEESSELSLGNLDRVTTEDSGPPDLEEECVEYSFEDSESACEREQKAIERTSSGPAALVTRDVGWRQTLGWDFGPESPTDGLENADLWDCHRSKLEELEEALQKIRM